MKKRSLAVLLGPSTNSSSFKISDFSWTLKSQTVTLYKLLCLWFSLFTNRQQKWKVRVLRVFFGWFLSRNIFATVSKANVIPLWSRYALGQMTTSFYSCLPLFSRAALLFKKPFLPPSPLPSSLSIDKGESISRSHFGVRKKEWEKVHGSCQESLFFYMREYNGQHVLFLGFVKRALGWVRNMWKSKMSTFLYVLWSNEPMHGKTELI